LGISRATRAGRLVAIAGTAPLGPNGRTVGIGDAAEQARRCLEIIEQAIRKLGGDRSDVIRTRILLTRIEDWEAVGAVHADFFRDVRPVNTVMQIGRFIDPDWLVEIEADAFLDVDRGLPPESITSLRAPEPVGPYPHARRLGNLLFLSGIGPRTRGSREIPGVTLDAAGNVIRYDFERQCRMVFENVRAVLEDAGARWEDIVDVTVFLTNMRDDFPVYNRLYAEYFPTDRPARTTVEVTALPTPIAIEVKVVAALSQ
jgi:2-aminomuconate deaminase